MEVGLREVLVSKHGESQSEAVKIIAIICCLKTHMHTSIAIHFPVAGFTLFHLWTAGGSNAPKKCSKNGRKGSAKEPFKANM